MNHYRGKAPVHFIHPDFKTTALCGTETLQTVSRDAANIVNCRKCLAKAGIIPSLRKPYNNRAGYVASRHSCIVKEGWMVIYDAEKAGIDSDKRYAVVCETHNVMATLNSLPGAREIMVSAEFCEECQAILHPRFPKPDTRPDVDARHGYDIGGEA